MIYFEMIKCFLRRDHHYFKEVIIDKNTTQNFCKCGKWLEFDWSYVGGHKLGISNISNLNRKMKWEDK